MFDSESRMIPSLREFALRELTYRDEVWAALVEHQLGSRIPDLVLARLDIPSIRRRIARGLARPLTPMEVTIVRAARRDSGTSLQRFRSLTEVSADYIAKLTNRLAAEGFLVRTPTGYVRANGWAPPVTRLITFEAKRNDWKGAFFQARAHRDLSHESYVAFDEAFAPRFDKAIHHYSAAGIGLVSLESETNKGRFLVRGRPRRSTGGITALAGETIWGHLVWGRVSSLPQTRLPSARDANGRPEAPLLVGPRPKTLERLLSDLESIAEPA